MAYWLIKEEPSHYSYRDLVRDGRTKWTGVRNALALQNLRRMSIGDLALYYHTGSERACVGIVRIASAPRPDPEDERGSWWVEVRPVRLLRRAISLAELKGDPALAQFDLLRISRLSIVAVRDEHWSRILARETPTAGDSPPVKVAKRGPGPTGVRGPARRAVRRRR